MNQFYYEKLDRDSNQHWNALLKWESDPDIAYLISPVRDPKLVVKNIGLENLKENYAVDKPKHAFILYDKLMPIGQFSIHIDPAHLYQKVKGTSWLGLYIGEKEYWGSGAGQKAMEFFEYESVKLGLSRVELGVFEFNIRAIEFYKKLGYQEIGRLKDFTYWNNKYWQDIRMEKILA